MKTRQQARRLWEAAAGRPFVVAAATEEDARNQAARQLGTKPGAVVVKRIIEGGRPQ